MLIFNILFFHKHIAVAERIPNLLPVQLAKIPADIVVFALAAVTTFYILDDIVIILSE